MCAGGGAGVEDGLSPIKLIFNRSILAIFFDQGVSKKCLVVDNEIENIFWISYRINMIFRKKYANLL